MDARTGRMNSRCQVARRRHAVRLSHAVPQRGPTDEITIASATEALETARFVAHFSTRIDPKALQ